MTETDTTTSTNPFHLEPEALALFQDKYEMMIERTVHLMRENPNHVSERAEHEVSKYRDQWGYSWHGHKWWHKIETRFNDIAADHIYEESYKLCIKDAPPMPAAISAPPAAPVATQNDDDDFEVPVIDRTELDAYNAKGHEATDFVTQADVQWLEKRLRKVFTESDLAEMNFKLARSKSKQRPLTWTEFSFIACVHKLSILTNKHQTENGEHQGDSPTNRAASIYDKGKHGLIIDRITTNHAGEVFRTLAKVGFARCIREYNPETKECGRYQAKASKTWGFPLP